MAGIDITAPTVWHVGGEDVRHRIPMLLRLREKGYSVAAVGSEKGCLFAEMGIPYYQYTLKRGVSPKADHVSLRQLTALMRQYRPDVVHAFDTKPGFLVPMAAERAGIQGVVRTVTGLGYVFSSGSLFARSLRPVYRAVQRRACAKTTVTVFQNQDDRKYFLHHRLLRDETSRYVAGSGIDSAHFETYLKGSPSRKNIRESLGIPQNAIVFSMVARIVRWKGVIEYLEAARRLRRASYSSIFLLIGPRASEGRQAVSKATLRKAAGVVTYLGARSDVPSILAASDVFVLPSYYREGVPRVLLEAACLGLPLIATDMPGCRDVVHNGWNGLLVPPQDAETLARSMMKLHGDVNLRREMGLRNRKFVPDKFGLDKVVSDYCAIYEDVIAQ